MRRFDNQQLTLFENPYHHNHYRSILSVSENRKGVLDLDTVKGCSFGMKAYPDGGCYGECYSYKIATRYARDFSVSITRKLIRSNRANVFFAVKNHHASWYRIGVSGDPSHDWESTISVCEALRYANKTPVIVTKHWISLSDNNLLRLKKLSAIINTSTSGMDTDIEISHRVEQIKRIKEAGIKSICRVVTCAYGSSGWASKCKGNQDYLLSLDPIIDNPFRVSKSNKHVINGDIKTITKTEAIGGNTISMHRPNIYLGICKYCPEQCGINL